MSAGKPSRGALEGHAVWFAAARTVQLRTEQVPPPGPGEVRVRAKASAISHGTEMLVYRGEVPEGLDLDLPTLVGSYAFPIKFGYATVGHVLDAGPGATLAPGTAVFVHHPHQDLFVVPEELAVPLPHGLEPLAGIFFANAETALGVVHDAAVRLGECAVVFGQGVVGLLVTRLLGLAGAHRVLAVDPLEARRELALEYGASEALAPEEVPERVFAATGGRGADVAVEVSSSGAALQAAIDAVAEEGTVVVASWYGTKTVSLSLGGRFHRGRVRLRSSQVGRIDPALGPRWDRPRRTQTVAGLLPELRPEGLVSHRIPLRDAPTAYRLVDERPDETVQVILAHDD